MKKLDPSDLSLTVKSIVIDEGINGDDNGILKYCTCCVGVIFTNKTDQTHTHFTIEIN